MVQPREGFHGCFSPHLRMWPIRPRELQTSAIRHAQIKCLTTSLLPIQEPTDNQYIIDIVNDMCQTASLWLFCMSFKSVSCLFGPEPGVSVIHPC